MYWKVVALLKSRGITVGAPSLEDFLIQDNSDGNGPFISEWDEVKLGPKPTVEELEAFMVEAEIEKQKVLDTPRLEDVVEALAEGLDAVAQGKPIPDAAQQILDKRVRVQE